MALPALASAQPAPGQAEALFRQGRELLAGGKVAEACAAFDASQRLEPAITTMLNQAACREKNAQLATAWGLFVEAERQTRSATDDVTKKLHQSAASRASELEPRLSRLTIRVAKQLDGLEVLRDRQVVAADMWNRPLPIDGATYTIIARAPGHEAWTTTVVIAPVGDTKLVEVPALVHSHRTERPPPVATAAVPRSTTPAWILGGSAVALLAGAAGLEIVASSTYASSLTATSSSDRESRWHRANTERYAAEGMAVAGLACAGVLAWWYLRGHDERPARAALSLQPHVAPGIAGLQLTGHY